MVVEQINGTDYFKIEDLTYDQYKDMVERPILQAQEHFATEILASRYGVYIRRLLDGDTVATQFMKRRGKPVVYVRRDLIPLLALML